jgi:hypothetical protein
MDRDALLGVESFIVGKGAVELERLSKMIQTSISFGIVRHVGLAEMFRREEVPENRSPGAPQRVFPQLRLMKTGMAECGMCPDLSQ